MTAAIKLQRAIASDDESDDEEIDLSKFPQFKQAKHIMVAKQLAKEGGVNFGAIYGKQGANNPHKVTFSKSVVPEKSNIDVINKVVGGGRGVKVIHKVVSPPVNVKNKVSGPPVKKSKYEGFSFL